MDTQLLNELIRRIGSLEREVERLKSFEFAKVIFLDSIARLIDDVVTRTSPYSTNIQVTGVGVLPGQIRGIFYMMQVFPAAASLLTLNIDNPGGGSVVAFRNQTAGNAGTQGGFVSLDSNGQFTLNLSSGSYTRLIIDVRGYVL